MHGDYSTIITFDSSETLEAKFWGFFLTLNMSLNVKMESNNEPLCK